jgi:hypothetical protein
MSYAYQSYSGPQGLDPRKGQGNTAWLEKARSRETIVAADGQGKTCMVKATLPEPKSRAVYLVPATQQWLRRGSEYSKALVFPSRTDASSLLGAALYGDKGMKWGPNQVGTSYTRHHRMACSRRAFTRPVWPRSRSSTQTPGVTPGTGAPSGAHDRRYKGRGDSSESPTGRGKSGSLRRSTNEGRD